MWMNITFYAQSNVFLAIRQLEFALLRLIQHLNELFEVVQCMIQGKPVKLINPTTLHNILRNVSLNLPDGYELILGTQMYNVYSYYDLISITLVGDIHSVKIILNVPLKTVNRHFVLYKVIVLPKRVYGDKFVTYSFEHSYLGIDDKRHDFILLTQADLSRCIVNRITTCPANIAVYTAQKMTCLSSIYSIYRKTTTYVAVSCCSIIKLQPFYVMETRGNFIFRSLVKCPCDA